MIRTTNAYTQQREYSSIFSGNGEYLESQSGIYDNRKPYRILNELPDKNIYQNSSDRTYYRDDVTGNLYVQVNGEGFYRAKETGELDTFVGNNNTQILVRPTYAPINPYSGKDVEGRKKLKAELESNKAKMKYLDSRDKKWRQLHEKNVDLINALHSDRVSEGLYEKGSRGR